MKKKNIVAALLIIAILSGCPKEKPARNKLVNQEPIVIQTPEIIRILEKESIESISTTHAQNIYIQLIDGRTYKGKYIYTESGKYADDPQLYDILNLVIHIKENRPDKETRDWTIACE